MVDGEVDLGDVDLGFGDIALCEGDTILEV